MAAMRLRTAFPGALHLAKRAAEGLDFLFVGVFLPLG
jgi:hypothetical protein